MAAMASGSARSSPQTCAARCRRPTGGVPAVRSALPEESRASRECQRPRPRATSGELEASSNSTGRPACTSSASRGRPGARDGRRPECRGGPCRGLPRRTRPRRTRKRRPWGVQGERDELHDGRCRQHLDAPDRFGSSSDSTDTMPPPIRPRDPPSGRRANYRIYQ